MINLRSVNNYCKDDLSLIENYEEAVNSPEIWDCHHRLETDLNMTQQDLIDQGLYYNRPASELIFLTHGEHSKLHNLNLRLDTRRKNSESHKGEKNPLHGKYGANNPNYGSKRTEETRKKQSESHKGRPSPMKGKPAANKGKKRYTREDGTHYFA